MNTSLNLSKEELIAIKHLIEYYKGIELEYMADEEINIADNLSNKVCLKLREIKDKDFYINGVKMNIGKLYNISYDDDGVDRKCIIKFDGFDGFNIYLESGVYFASYIIDKNAVCYATLGSKVWGDKNCIINISEIIDEKEIEAYNNLIEHIIQIAPDDYAVSRVINDIDWEDIISGNYKLD